MVKKNSSAFGANDLGAGFQSQREQSPDSQKKNSFPWGWFFAGIFLIIILFFGFIAIAFLALIFGSGSGTEASGAGNVAVIPLKGVITSDSSSGFFAEGGASSTDIVKMIQDADSNPSIKAIIIEINSPGGAPVPSEEIGNALKKTNKTTVAWIRDMGTSGGYWVASSCDVIVANRMSAVSSIGVFGSYLEFSGLMNKYNVSYERLVAGEYKDAGVPFRKLTDEERTIFQGQLDSLHEIFILEIATNRNMTVDSVKKLADGMYMLGTDAKKNGLVDILGGKEEAVLFIEEREGIKAKLVYYQKQKSFLDMLSSVMHESSYRIGQGIGNSLSNDVSSNGEPHYSY